MNKHVFLKKLGEQLADLPREDVERLVEFYAELIDDKVENGETEGQAVANLGPIEEIIEGLHSESQENFIWQQRVDNGRKADGYGARLAVTICAFPIWLPLYLSAWTVIASLYISAVACGLAGAVFLIPSMIIMLQSAAVGFFQIGTCLAAAGFGIFLFVGTNYLTKYFLKCNRFFYNGIRYSFRKGGRWI